MYRFYTLRYWILIIISLIITTALTGIGMGVPILNILFGFVVGWYSTKRAYCLYDDFDRILRKIFIYCLFCSGITFILMLFIWARVIPMLFDPLFDFENFGHPMILYDAKSSLVGWLMLMILISPFLQLLSSIFSAFITIRSTDKKKNLGK